MNPDQSALVVVDVQNDYCDDHGAFGRNGAELGPVQAAAERIVHLVEVARRAGVPVVWVKTHHDKWTNSPMWLTRRSSKGLELCVPDSWGADFYRVKPAAGEVVVVKHRYSAFVGSRLEIVLRALARPTLIFSGVTTNVCVESTLRDAFMRDYDTVLVEDCAAAFTKPEHDGAVYNVRTYFGRVVDSATLEGQWSSGRSRS